MTEQVQFAGLEDLEAMDGDVMVCKIVMPDGKVKRFRLGVLGYAEYNEIIASVPEPAPPTHIVMGKREPNRDDPDYRAKRTAAEDTRRMRLLARSLAKGGLAVKGDTLAAQGEWMAQRATNVTVALLQGFTQAHHGLTGRLEQLADTFQPVSGAGDADTPGVETE